jgi:hypothetical protein
MNDKKSVVTALFFVRRSLIKSESSKRSSPVKVSGTSAWLIAMTCDASSPWWPAAKRECMHVPPAALYHQSTLSSWSSSSSSKVVRRFGVLLLSRVFGRSDDFYDTMMFLLN